MREHLSYHTISKSLDNRCSLISQNKVSFKGCINKFVLSSLSPSQVVKDQEQTHLKRESRMTKA